MELTSGPSRPGARAAPEQPLLLVIIPALNEAATIGEVIERIPRDLPGIACLEVLVIDDGSTDATVAIARDKGAGVISHSRNLGVGRAMQTGLAYAIRRGAAYVVNLDADGQFAPEDIPALLAPLLRGEAEVATASRFKEARLVPTMPRAKLLGNRAMSWIISRLTGERFYDVSCGFRAYRREAILRLILTGSFTYTQEMFLALSSRQIKIVEVPLRVRGVREHGTSRVAGSLPRYAWKTSRIILGCVRDYRPGLFFGTIALALLFAGSGLATFFFGHWLLAGAFSPHLWAGFLSAFLVGLALVFFIFGQIAAMLDRLRMLQEEQLYILRRGLATDARAAGSLDAATGLPLH